MAEGRPTGSPYPDASSSAVDDWSRRIFEALSDWNPARQGAWTRWDPGYLLLEVGRVDGQVVEPILIDTADEELTVTFGYWETHLPEPLGTGDADAKATAGQARRLVEDWLSGRVKTAVLTEAGGKWCGSVLIEPGELDSQLRDAARSVRDFNPARVEVRTASRGDWKTYAVEPDWLLRPAPSSLAPGRLPK